MNSQDLYSAITYALDAANDNGYLSHFVFVKALNVALATILIPHKFEVQENENVLSLYDRLDKEGVIHEATDKLNMCSIYDMANLEFKNYQKHLDGVSGSIGAFMDFVNNKFTDGIKELSQTINNSDMQKVQEIASNWGMDNMPVSANQ